MFRDKTLFVLGAGASCEAGLPLGSELAETLASDLFIRTQSGSLISGNESIAVQLDRVSQKAGRQKSELISAARTVAAGVRDAESIDNFVELHAGKPDIQLVAKIGISVAIARAEKQSRLFQFDSKSHRWIVREGHDANHIRPRDTWYQKFFDIAKDGVQSRNLEEIFKEVRIICFNYDRTLELFLFKRIQSLYAVDASTAAKAVRNLDIVRPYGWLGPLPEVDHENSFDFGRLDFDSDFARISENIRTYSELPGSETIQRLEDTMHWAEHIVFLGFGFHKQNMRLLRRWSSREVNVYATAREMSEPNKMAIKQRIHETFEGKFKLPTAWVTGHNPFLENASCGQLLSHYREVLRS